MVIRINGVRRISRFGGYYDTFHPELCEICEILLTGGGDGGIYE